MVCAMVRTVFGRAVDFASVSSTPAAAAPAVSAAVAAEEAA